MSGAPQETGGEDFENSFSLFSEWALNNNADNQNGAQRGAAGPPGPSHPRPELEDDDEAADEQPKKTTQRQSKRPRKAAASDDGGAAGKVCLATLYVAYYPLGNVCESTF